MAAARPGRPAAAEVWSGWVGIAEKTGFGLVSPLPGIWPSLHLDTTITLPVGVEAYAAYALRAWLASEGAVSARTRRFAKWSAICSFALGMAGQVTYHLLAQAGMESAPWAITTIVSCLPVLVLAMGTALAHMLRADAMVASDGPDGGMVGPAMFSPAWSREDLAETGRATRVGSLAGSDPPSSSRMRWMSSHGEHGTIARITAPATRVTQGQRESARFIARRLATEGKRVSRRTLRHGGTRGSNATLNALAREMNAELSGQPHHAGTLEDSATGAEAAHN